MNDRKYVFHFRPKPNIWPEKHLALGRIPKPKENVQIHVKLKGILVFTNFFNNSDYYEKSMTNIIRSQSKTQNDSIDDDLKFTIKGDLQKYVLSVSVSVFGLMPDVFPVRYLVSD